MTFVKELYVGEAADKKLHKIVRKFREGKIQTGVYVLTLAANGTDLLDIIPSFMLSAERYKDIYVLGIALTKQEAMEVGEQIIMDVYGKTGGFDLRTYFGK